MLRIDTTQIDRMESVLKKHKDNAIPFAISDTVNAMAKTHAGVAGSNLKKSFILRSSYVLRGLKTSEIKGQWRKGKYASTKHISPFMTMHDEGGSVRKDSTPTNKARIRGQYKKQVRKNLRSRRNGLRMPIVPKVGVKKQSVAVAFSWVRRKDLEGKPVVFTINGKTGVWEFDGNKMTRLYYIEKRTNRVKSTRFFSDGATFAEKKADAIYRKMLIKSLRRVGDWSIERGLS